MHPHGLRRRAREPARETTLSTCPPPARDWLLFETWCQHGRLPKERPAGLRRQVPSAWFDCYRRLHPKPLRDYGLMARSGWAVTNHASGPVTEKIVEAKRVGFDYLMLWIDGANAPVDWAEWRRIALGAGISIVPGMHCHTPADVTALLQVAADWGAVGVGVNVEAEAETTLPPALVQTRLQAWLHSAAIIVDYRGYIDASGYHGPDWSLLADRAVGIIEAFTNDGQQRDIPACLDRLRQQGFKARVPMPRTTGPRNVTLPAGSRCGWTLDTVAVAEIAGWAA